MRTAAALPIPAGHHSSLNADRHSMTKRLIAAAIAVICAIAAYSDEMPEKCRINFNNTTRTYRMYMPEGLEKGAPLCLYIHG